MKVLVLTGPPAVGKTTIGRRLATRRTRCALIDVDDVRQLIVSGGAAPWCGPEGLMQQRLGVVNACALAINFVQHGVDAVVADVLTNETAGLYRYLLRDALIVQLTVDYDEALERAQTRTVHLTPDEFNMLHEQQSKLSGMDERLDTTSLTAEGTARSLARLWLTM